MCVYRYVYIYTPWTFVNFFVRMQVGQSFPGNISREGLLLAWPQRSCLDSFNQVATGHANAALSSAWASNALPVIRW